MDNFFELLPFIIGILYFVFGRNKKTKESPKPARKPKSKPRNRPTLEEVLRELSGEIIPEPEPVKLEIPEPTPIPVVVEETQAVYQDHIEHSGRQGKKLKEIRKEISDEQHLKQPKAEIEFDLRQAVINDAILNRPYS